MADKTPAAPRKSMPLSGATSGRAEISEFIVRARGLAPGSRAEAEPGAGRLIFALDATMSRQPTWDAACSLQAEMFRATEEAGGLSVQLAYFRGINEARASRWVSDADALSRLMTGLACHGGLTQIGRILDHAAREARRAPVAALVYVGDAMEEPVDLLVSRAGELALLGTKAFLFQEGTDAAATAAFREVARVTGGAHVHLDSASASTLGRLLRAVAAYAAGGMTALEDFGRGDAAGRALLTQMR
jgi:hypothetical protein